MTRQLAGMGNVSIPINESELAFLRLVQDAGGTLQLSVRGIAERLGLKDRSASRIARRLEEKGLIEIRRRFLENGGQLENEYQLTSVGRDVLQALRDAPTAGT